MTWAQVPVFQEYSQNSHSYYADDMVESVGKKFLSHIETSGVELLKWSQPRRRLGQNPLYREKFDWAVARAVASMPVLAEYLLPLVRVGGAILAQKGESAHAEVQSAEKALRILGGNLRKITSVTLPSIAEERFLVILDKKAARLNTPGPGYH
jgi:16S rRNA (guanine527-N7)-methyltransferase